MTTSSHDSQYELIARLSDNRFTQSWQARDKRTGQPVFVKTPSGNPELEPAFIVDTLRKSSQEQAALPLRLTVRNRRFLSEDSTCVVAYPWLDDLITYPDFLTAADLTKVFAEIAFLTDYLHALGLVHRDLKLSNFVSVPFGDSRYLALADLDLLTAVNTPCEKKIFGTPGFIAPEVVANRVFTARADLYSLGRSAEEYFRQHGQSPVTAPWKRLLSELTEVNPYSRPEYFLETLQRSGLITEQDLQHQLRRLLAVLILSRFRQRRPGGKGWLQRFVHEQNQVFGIPPELLADLEDAFSTRPRSVFHAFRLLIEKANVSRLGEFWMLQASDDILFEIYALIGQSIADEYSRPSGQTANSIIPGVPYALHDYPLKRLLTIKRTLTQGAEGAASGLAVQLEEAGDLAMILNRSSEAYDHFERALELEMSDHKRLCLLRKTVFQLVILFRYTLAREKNALALSLARTLGDNEALLDIRRQIAWFAAIDGQFGEAAELLEAVIQEAHEQKLEFVRIRCLAADHQRNILLQEHERGIRRAEEIIAAADEAGHPEYSFATRIGLLFQYFTIGAYRKAETLAQQIDRMSRLPHLNYTNLWFYTNRFNYLTRLGEFGKAKYWLHRTLSDSDPVSHSSVFRRYFADLAWIQVEEGRLVEAEQNALRSLSFTDITSRPEEVSMTFQNLCNASMRMGQFATCEEFGKKAVERFGTSTWPLGVEETRMILELNQAYNGSGIAWESLLGRLARLFELQALYYAVTLTFHILVNADEPTAQRALKIFDGATTGLSDDDFPLLEATRLLALGRTGDVRQRVSFSKALKASIRVLENIGEIFLSMQICRRIANLGQEEVSRRRARGYLEMALTYAQALPNETAEEQIRQKLALLGSGGDTRQKLLESMLSLSQLFSDETRYEIALTRMLRFAVDESGAERGALFLVSSQTGQLLLRASIDCDEASLKDIEGTSNRLLSQAKLDPEPRVIPDARADENLQKYQSVVANNIRSVATVPMFDGDKLRGILYMDHHTVPARFDNSDLLYIRTIANLLSVMLDAMDRQRTVIARVELLDDDRRQMGVPNNVIAEDPSMLKLLKELPQIARTNASILFRGESGTGKEVLVEMAHALSLRADKPLVKVNCAAISRDLMEVELFGIRGGTASNAVDRQGKFEFADGGTLFLDEIGDMPERIQTAVLRCLEYQTFERIGSNRTIHTDIRFIYATNKNLEEMVEKGTFRFDLYQRIKVIDLHIPPLRERPKDILPLINHYVKAFRGQTAEPIRFSKEALSAILQYRWPGNVREVRNMVERLVILHQSDCVEIKDLPDSIKSTATVNGHAHGAIAPKELTLLHLAGELGLDLRWLESDLEQARRPGHTGLSAFELLEKEMIRLVVKSNKGNASRTARMLRYSVATLRRRLIKYGLDHRM